MHLPDWMLENNENQVVAHTGGKNNKSNYLKKSLRNMRAIICEDRQTEYYARCEGALQKISPPIKLLAMLGLILTATLSRQIPFLLLIWLVTLLLMYKSNLPVGDLQKKIWGFIPLLTLLFSLPATLNIFINGTPLIYLCQPIPSVDGLGSILGQGLFITRQGVTAVLFLFLRVGISLSLGVLLVMTTPVTEVFGSLRVIRVPELFIMIMEMAYRYMMVLLLVSMEMFEARTLRTVGKVPLKMQRAQVGTSIAALFARSVALAEEVYQAMCARGYTGENIETSAAEVTELEAEVKSAINMLFKAR